jgi:hypothetical protein
LLCVAALSAVLASRPVADRQNPDTAPNCRAETDLVRLPGLSEASGVAASRRHPGRLWSHNDSGTADLVTLTDRGAVSGRIRLTGLAIDDWEALAVAPCPGGSCLYIADIGDNDATRERITIHRLPEPDTSATSAAVRESFHASYPDGAHDAETLLVGSKGEMFVVTKGETGPVALYRFPLDAKPGATVKLEAVGKARGGKTSQDDHITDGAFSPDGTWIVLRTKTALQFYLARDLIAGNWREIGRSSVANLKEPQGEGLAFVDDRTLVLVSEGPGESQAGTFVRMNCMF